MSPSCFYVACLLFFLVSVCAELVQTAVSFSSGGIALCVGLSSMCSQEEVSSGSSYASLNIWQCLSLILLLSSDIFKSS